MSVSIAVTLGLGFRSGSKPKPRRMLFSLSSSAVIVSDPFAWLIMANDNPKTVWPQHRPDGLRSGQLLQNITGEPLNVFARRTKFQNVRANTGGKSGAFSIFDRVIPVSDRRRLRRCQ